MPVRARRWSLGGGVARASVVAAALLPSTPGAPAEAQTHYYNLDAGRPTRVEDAVPIERYGLDLHLAALRFERLDGGTYRWRAEPKIAYGLFPMTSLEVRAPVAYVVHPGVARGTTALAGVGVGGLHALNVEKTWLPALAVSGEALLPAGGFSSGRTSYGVQLLATKTTPAVRTHLNASLGTYGIRPPRELPAQGACPPAFYQRPDGTCAEIIVHPEVPCALLPGDRSDAADSPRRAAAMRCAAAAEITRAGSGQQFAQHRGGLRWAVGIGADRTLPLRSTLVSANVVAEHFIGLFPQTDWTAELGIRRQWSPQIVIDAGVGRRFAGATPSSWVSLGATYAFATRGLRLPRGLSTVGSTDPSATGPYEQAYLPARHNWTMRERYPEAERLLNAFDYGHAILYETLLRHRPTARSGSRLDGRVYDYVVGKVLRRPPRLTLEERAVGPRYATLVPELLAMFEWAHVLHRQLYDVMADERSTPAERQARAREVLRYYQSRADLALSAAPKAMHLMEGQPYSLAFRRAAPKFNGLIWSYHWLQIALYEALLVGDDAAGRRANVDASLGRFWAMLDSAPARLPTVMPMSPAVASRFSEQYPEAAIIFDNLHALHDVAADILASPLVPETAKRTEILRAAAAYRDSTTAATSREEWREHSLHMGVEQMGGRAPVAASAPVAPGAAIHERR